MRKTRDVLYTIFMGLILFLSGAVILGGISYFIDRYIGIDFVSVLLYFFMATFLTKRIMMNIVSRGIFYSIILPIYTGLMYLIKDYLDAAERLKDEPVEVLVGNHLGNYDALGKVRRRQENPDGPNPFVVPGEWKRFLTQRAEMVRELMREDPAD